MRMWNLADEAVNALEQLPEMRWELNPVAMCPA